MKKVFLFLGGDGKGAKLVANLSWLPALAIGALQMYRVDAGVLTSHGADFFGPIALYASFRTNGTIARWFMRSVPSPLASATFVLAGCVAWEWCQRFDLRGTPLAITRGTFDPLDIAAYVAGVSVALVTEKVAVRYGRVSRIAAPASQEASGVASEEGNRTM